jgi:hypothetical protein
VRLAVDLVAKRIPEHQAVNLRHREALTVIMSDSDSDEDGNDDDQDSLALGVGGRLTSSKIDSIHDLLSDEDDEEEEDDGSSQLVESSQEKQIKIPKKSKMHMSEILEQRKLRERQLTAQTAQLRWQRTIKWLESLRTESVAERVLLALLRDRKRLQWAIDTEATSLDQPYVALLLLESLHIASGSSLPSWSRALFALITESDFIHRISKVWFEMTTSKLVVRNKFRFDSTREQLQTCWLFKLIQLLGRWANRLQSVDAVCGSRADLVASMMDAMRTSLAETCFKPGTEELQRECESQLQRLNQLPRGNPRRRFSQSPRAATMAANFPSSASFQSPTKPGLNAELQIPSSSSDGGGSQLLSTSTSRWDSPSAVPAAAGGAAWKTPPPRLQVPDMNGDVQPARSPRSAESTNHRLEREMLAFRTDPPFPPLETVVMEEKARSAETKASEAAAEANPGLKGSAGRAGAGAERLEDAHGLLGVCHQLRYRTSEHYLATHYWLLREDFIRPMREAIASIHKRGLERARTYKDGAALEGVRVYTNCVLGARVPLPQRGVICQRLHIVGEQQKARCVSLVYGSLVAISAQQDGFKTTLDWALVVNSDEALLEQGIIDVAFDYTQGAHQFGAAALTPAPTSNSPRSAAASACALDAYSPRGHFAGAAPGSAINSPSDSSSVVAVAPPRLKGKRLLLLESLAYYEGCRHVLRALQRVPLHSGVPFSDYLINGQQEVRLPRYLSEQEGPGRMPVQYDLQCLTRVHARPAGGGGIGCESEGAETSNGSSQVQQQQRAQLLRISEGAGTEQDSPLEVAVSQLPWPNFTTPLDTSQLEAVKLLLLKEFAVVQGPPGTGKTFIGLKVVEAMLLNQRRAGWEGPLIVMCYTNHALDQFLEGVMKFEPNIVRIGSRSKSKAVNERSLNKLLHQKVVQHYKKMDRMRKRSEGGGRGGGGGVGDGRRKKNVGAKSISELLAGSDDDEDEDEDESGAAYKGDSDPIYVLRQRLKKRLDVLAHLLEGDTGREDKAKRRKEKKKEKAKSKPNTKGKSNAKSKAKSMAKKFAQSNTAGEEEGSESEKTGAKGKRKRVIMSDSDSDDDGNADDQSSSSSSSSSDGDSEDEEKSAQSRHQLLLEFRERAEQLSELERMRQLWLLQQARVVGFTTTGAAKNQMLLELLQARVMVVEEAAEVLEGHVLTALGSHTEHLIQIGDHQQLRPGTNVHELNLKYDMDTSIFERMVTRNGLHCHQLSVQRRMRPEIADLMRLFYPRLADHSVVEGRDNINGMAHNLFFHDMTHQVRRLYIVYIYGAIDMTQQVRRL